MVIEWLQFQIDPDLREIFLQKDDELWTIALSQYPGFMGKEVWISPHNPREVIMVIRWASYEQWKAIPIDDLEKIEQRFQQHLPSNGYTMVASRDYQVSDRATP